MRIVSRSDRFPLGSNGPKSAVEGLRSKITRHQDAENAKRSERDFEPLCRKNRERGGAFLNGGGAQNRRRQLECPTAIAAIMEIFEKRQMQQGVRKEREFDQEGDASDQNAAKDLNARRAGHRLSRSKTT